MISSGFTLAKGQCTVTQVQTRPSWAHLGESKDSTSHSKSCSGAACRHGACDICDGVLGHVKVTGGADGALSHGISTHWALSMVVVMLVIVVASMGVFWACTVATLFSFCPREHALMLVSTGPNTTAAKDDCQSRGQRKQS